MAKPLKKPNRISRRKQMKKSPIPWIVLIFVSLVIYFVFAHDNLSEWQSAKAEIKNDLELNKGLEEEIANLIIERDEAEEEFERIAKPEREIERQILPQNIDTRRIVKILEIFSIQLLNIIEEDYDPVFRLDSLNIGSPSRDDSVPGVQRTLFTLNITTDQQNLETFIRFLQTNTIPPRLERAKNNGLISDEELPDYKLLETQKLPIMIIDNLTKSSAATPENPTALRVSLSVFFYHQIPGQGGGEGQGGDQQQRQQNNNQ